jgi:hypothetical protein
MRSAQVSFPVSIRGNVTVALYDSRLAESCILMSFCSSNHLYHHLNVCDTTVTVEISRGKYFSSLIKLRVLEGIASSHVYNVILGRDWFEMCSTGLEDSPDAAVRLPSSDQWLIFAASPDNPVRDLPPPFSKLHSFDTTVIKTYNLLIFVQISLFLRTILIFLLHMILHICKHRQFAQVLNFALPILDPAALVLLVCHRQLYIIIIWIRNLILKN